MKKILIHSHALHDPMILSNGDEYDSEADVYNDGKLLYHVPWVNVDSSNDYDPYPELPDIQKIEVANGRYYGYVGKHKGKYKAFILLNRLPKQGEIKGGYPIEGLREFPTIQTNPRHDGEKLATCVNWHRGGWKGDWSEGCFTTPEPYFEKFMEHFEDGEIVEIEKV